MLRAKKVVGKFVEFFGPGVSSLSLADRATVANMAPEYGATMGFFPVDEQTLKYLKQTGRPQDKINLVEKYTRAQGLFRTEASGKDVEFSEVLSLDLSTVEPCLAGPKRPQDRVPLRSMAKDFKTCMESPAGFKGFGVEEDKRPVKSSFTYQGKPYDLHHGSVVIAAITSCTNTSNPGVMLGAALLAKKAVDKGLKVKPYIKTSLSPGSKAVTEYLRLSGLTSYLEALGFYHAGYGCMTCIGNSGELDPEVNAAILAKDIVAAAVLSGNRNFEARVHPLTRANYLASPPLVVAYALAGKIDIDFEKEPIGKDQEGRNVFLKDIWPTLDEVRAIEEKTIKGEMFTSIYKKIQEGTSSWNSLKVPEGKTFKWSDDSTYIHNPPFFQSTKETPPPVEDIDDAYCLLNLGHSITTDHISPAGDIHATSAAAKYLNARGIDKPNFNTYGSRRGNDEIMVRGTFANRRLTNKLCPNDGPQTVHIPTGQTLTVFDAAERYKKEDIPTIVLAGSEYGSGSSRDWAAKGPFLMGIKAVIAESFERIHRTNLIGMGVLPLEFLPNESATSLGLSGKERFTIKVNGGDIKPGEILDVKVQGGKSFKVKARIDTPIETTYYKHGGILQFVLRKILAESKKK